ncbi:MAG TPA: DUF6600 domain-containing protein, partial [Polyangiaceae bacterium]
MISLRPMGLVPLLALLAFASLPGSDAPALAQSGAEPDYDPSQQAEEVAVGVEGDRYADTDPAALTDFRGTLDPHGSWVDDADYGTVWVPNTEEVGQDFTPYVTSGSWAYDEDFVWESAFEWGWVPFHYGRWAWIEQRRWGWIPGREYAGAWVEWWVGPNGYGYVGWNTLAPSFGWRGGVAYGFPAGYARPPAPVFCAREEVFAPRVYAKVVVGDAARAVAVQTRPYVRAQPVVAGRSVMRGPSPAALGIDAGRIVRVNEQNAAVAR